MKMDKLKENYQYKNYTPDNIKVAIEGFEMIAIMYNYSIRITYLEDRDLRYLINFRIEKDEDELFLSLKYEKLKLEEVYVTKLGDSFYASSESDGDLLKPIKELMAYIED